MRLWLPIALVLAATGAGLVGAPIISFYLLLLAVPMVGCLAVFGLQALLGAGVELRRPVLER